jgi:hypothetical protein
LRTLPTLLSTGQIFSHSSGARPQQRQQFLFGGRFFVGEHRAFSMLAYVWRRTRDAETGAAQAILTSPFRPG